MNDRPKLPEEMIEPDKIHFFEPGMVLRSTKTDKLLFVTQVSHSKIRGKAINQDGELEDPNPDKWIEIDIDIAQKFMVEVADIDVSKLQGYIQKKVEKATN